MSFYIKENFKKRLYLLILSFWIFLGNSFSAKIHPKAGETSATFLKIPIGVRASAIGGGYSSISGDIYSSFYNPAGSADIEKRMVSFMHNIHFEGISQYIFFYGFIPDFFEEIKDYSSISVNYINYGSQDRRSGMYETNPFSPSPVEGEFDSKDLSVSANYSVLKTTDLFLGFNIKFINQSIDEENSFAFALDMGSIKKIKIKDRDYNIGISILNLGNKIKMISKSYPLPLALKFGISGEYKKAMISFDILKYSDNYPYLIIGFENKITKDLYLRLGYRYRLYGNDLGFWSAFSSGLGFDYRNFSFGYSLNSYGDLGYSHKIELTVKYK